MKYPIKGVKQVLVPKYFCPINLTLSNKTKMNYMKKILGFVMVLICLTTGAIAQNTFIKGQKVLNLGIGLGSTFYTGGYYTSKIPPLSASMELGVKDNLFDAKSSLGIGGYLGFTGAKYQIGNWGFKYSNIIIGVRGVVHYQLVDKLDTYTGLLLGYNIVSAKEFGTDLGGFNYKSSTSGLAYSWFVGGRYYFNEKFAGLLELGYGISYLNLGVSLKF